MSKENDELVRFIAEIGDFCLRLDCRMMAFEGVIAERLHQNQEQIEAFHEDVSAKYKLIYETRMKQAAEDSPDALVKLLCLIRKTNT